MPLRKQHGRILGLREGFFRPVIFFLLITIVGAEKGSTRQKTSLISWGCFLVASNLCSAIHCRVKPTILPIYQLDMRSEESSRSAKYHEFGNRWTSLSKHSIVHISRKWLKTIALSTFGAISSHSFSPRFSFCSVANPINEWKKVLSCRKKKARDNSCENEIRG